MRLRISGVVQGVGFRPAVVRVARQLGLNGHVRNDGSNVEVVLDGEAEAFIETLARNLPPMARIDRIERSEGWPENRGFVILESSDGQRSSELPPDTALCPQCLGELADRADRRFAYPFTACTGCGERFSVVRDLPYDRARTAMDPFKMCGACRSEYGSQDDRRFHHQTVACPECGPRYTFHSADGKAVDGGITRFAELLDAGAYGVAKGWGGAHICCTTAVAPRFRIWCKREAKPFAIMVRNIAAARGLFDATPAEERELVSPQRPIVLLRKRVENEVMDALAPGLDTVGVMLPYSGMHQVLFSHLKAEALVMTSANQPGAPMCIDDKDAFGLGAEWYLLHDREIANRCDDSVVKLYGGNRFFVRRSRGYVPSSLRVGLRGTAVGVGPGENVTSCVAKDGLLTPSQYIGDSANYDVLDYHASATRHLMRLRGADALDAVAIDLHPGYPTRRLGEEMAEELGARLVEVQHHWAHGLSLMAEHGLERAVVVALDGTGYGDDGQSWGGEVIACGLSDYERAGHLEYIPLPGGDEAVKDPRRILFAIEESLGLDSERFEGREANVLRAMLPKAVKTSSAGRVLDALSFYLGACGRWTYDGEPAMRLEPLLVRGRPEYGFEVEVRGGVIATKPLFARLFEMRPSSNSERCNAASSFVAAMVEGLVSVAVETADRTGTEAVGLSGGVSYSLPVARCFEEAVLKAGKRPMLHDKLPNGDGGISAGQCVAALASVEG